MTTAPPFAALEARLNSAALGRLANAMATIGATSFAVIFDSAYSLAAVGPAGMASSSPACTVQTAVLPPEVVGQAITIGAQVYTVVSHEPDGTGMSRLWLQEAA